VPPSVRECLPEAGQGRDDTRDENSAPATKGFVHGVGEPAAQNSAAEIGGRIRETQQPSVALAFGTNAKSDLVEWLSSVNHRFIHSLDSGAKGANYAARLARR